MKNTYLRKLLSSSDLDVINYSIGGLSWFDGALTSNPDLKVSEMAFTEGDDYKTIDDLVFTRFTEDSELTYITQPKSTTRTTVSRMDVGGRYDLHVDSANLGHYSTTTFLSDPSTYDGGELVLHIDGESVVVKPEAGWSMTYLTGTPHTVKPVTRGTRLVCVNWTTSEFSNPVLREFSTDIHRCRDIINTQMQYTGDFENDLTSPRYIMAELHCKIRRLVL